MIVEFGVGHGQKTSLWLWMVLSLACLELVKTKVLPPSGGSHTHSICLFLPGLASLSVFGIHIRLSLTLIDISLFLLLCTVHSNPLQLLNGESWRTYFFAKTSDRWIACKQDFVVYQAKQFPFPFARVQLIFHTQGCCWCLQSEFNIHLPTTSRACHFGAGA